MKICCNVKENDARYCQACLEKALLGRTKQVFKELEESEGRGKKIWYTGGVLKSEQKHTKENMKKGYIKIGDIKRIKAKFLQEKV